MMRLIVFIGLSKISASCRGETAMTGFGLIKGGSVCFFGKALAPEKTDATTRSVCPLEGHRSLS